MPRGAAKVQRQAVLLEGVSQLGHLDRVLRMVLGVGGVGAGADRIVAGRGSGSGDGRLFDMRDVAGRGAEEVGDEVGHDGREVRLGCLAACRCVSSYSIQWEGAPVESDSMFQSVNCECPWDPSLVWW